MEPDSPWLTAGFTHEGFPLALRVRIIDRDCTQEMSHLGLLIHTLEQVREDGMPEPSYNLSLAELDASVHDLLPGSQAKMMIVETFGGLRSYYACFREEQAHRDWVVSVQNAFPDDRFEGDFQPRRAWGFYSAYRTDFGW